MAAPEEIVRLVENFKEQLDSYKTGAYNETQVRRDYIDPFFKALGWDIDNTQGHAETYREVIHEDKIKIGKTTKAPDYSFRIGGSRKFFVEAKKPSVDLKDELSPAIQVRRYGWNAKLPLSIITDFEEFTVYDTRIKPQPKDKVATARLMYFTYEEYVGKWHEISKIFSREAILKGSFDKFVKEGKKKGTAEVDEEFLKDIEIWRELLARNIALRNDMTQRDLNYAVQSTIDRIIFLRICEDRGIESYGQLANLVNKNDIYPNLIRFFKDADDKYNSGLFHFKDEKDRASIKDTLTPHLKIDDKVLKNIIKNLYYPCPYEFSVMSSDILGSVYERFLGKKINLSVCGHRVKVEEKPEVKKAGGVYYTPSYIVDYIVKNTVGELIKSKTPLQIKKVRILDPACGSGSFLIAAYQELLDRHLNFYLSNQKKYKKFIYQTNKNNWRLTTAIRKEILLNNIYGVDIDSQAVEVTKLSLLLKVLEGESKETIQKQLSFFNERALPDLSNNIKCGNSLVGLNYSVQQQLGLSDEEQYKVNIFSWENEFNDILVKGGFDVVIGNPPYVNVETLDKITKNYLFDNYKFCKARTDIYIAFIEKSLSLLKNKGFLSFIIPYAFTNQIYGTDLRQFLIKEFFIKEIVDTSNYYVFKRANVKNVIINIQNMAKGQNNCNIKKYTDKQSFEQNIGLTFAVNQKEFLGLKDCRLETKQIGDVIVIKEKIGDLSIPLEKICFVAYGARLNHKSKKIGKSNYIHRDRKHGFKPFLEGKNIERYNYSQEGWLNYCPAEHYNPMFTELFENEKLMFINVVKDRLRFVYDKNCLYNSHTVINCVKYDQLLNVDYVSVKRNINSIDVNLTKKYSYKMLLGILNSKLINWYFLNFLTEGVHFYPNDAKSLPIPHFDYFKAQDYKKIEQLESLVDKMIELSGHVSQIKNPQERVRLDRQIKDLDKKIDILVYNLYQLNSKEISAIETG